MACPEEEEDFQISSGTLSYCMIAGRQHILLTVQTAEDSLDLQVKMTSLVTRAVGAWLYVLSGEFFTFRRSLEKTSRSFGSFRPNSPLKSSTRNNSAPLVLPEMNLGVDWTPALDLGFCISEKKQISNRRTEK